MSPEGDRARRLFDDGVSNLEMADEANQVSLSWLSTSLADYPDLDRVARVAVLVRLVEKASAFQLSVMWAVLADEVLRLRREAGDGS